MGGKVAAAVSVTVITGPTASGKSAEGLARAHADPSIEIVNADSQLLYRGFDIGTAKPSREERADVTHHLIDILEPDQRFSASNFSQQARTAIREIIARGKTPLVVGGTGFYIDALFRGLMTAEIDPEKLLEARRKFEEEITTHGFESMHERLRSIDPELHSQIAREMNPVRLVRAWTHYYATGTPLGEARKQQRDAFEYRPEFIILSPAREELHTRIEQRIDQMLTNGWLDEVKELKTLGIDRNAPAMRAIGYGELLDVLEHKLTLEQARQQIVIRTRQYAKRQVTWLRHQTSS